MFFTFVMNSYPYSLPQWKAARANIFEYPSTLNSNDLKIFKVSWTNFQDYTVQRGWFWLVTWGRGADLSQYGSVPHSDAESGSQS
jgi:hypothetical protein